MSRPALSALVLSDGNALPNRTSRSPASQMHSLRAQATALNSTPDAIIHSNHDGPHRPTAGPPPVYARRAATPSRPTHPSTHR
jgi:hypothetical protein